MRQPRRLHELANLQSLDESPSEINSSKWQNVCDNLVHSPPPVAVNDSITPTGRMALSPVSPKRSWDFTTVSRNSRSNLVGNPSGRVHGAGEKLRQGSLYTQPTAAQGDVRVVNYFSDPKCVLRDNSGLRRSFMYDYQFRSALP